MDNNNTVRKTEAESVAEIAREGVLPVLLGDIDKKAAAPFAVWPKINKVESLERLLAAPVRKRASVTVHDALSFTGYVLRHIEPGTVVFEDGEGAAKSFTAHIDYHLGAKDGARFCDHECVLRMAHSEEWNVWTRNDNRVMSQLEMAEFIEENMSDIVSPEGARMLEIVKTLEATQGVEFKSLVRLENGDRGINYQLRTGAKAGQSGEIEIPATFTLCIPVFRFGVAMDVECRFRYNIKEGQLRMGYIIARPQKIIDGAMDVTREIIVKSLESTGIAVLKGSAAGLGVGSGF